MRFRGYGGFLRGRKRFTKVSPLLFLVLELFATTIPTITTTTFITTLILKLIDNQHNLTLNYQDYFLSENNSLLLNKNFYQLFTTNNTASSNRVLSRRICNEKIKNFVRTRLRLTNRRHTINSSTASLKNRSGNTIFQNRLRRLLVNILLMLWTTRRTATKSKSLNKIRKRSLFFNRLSKRQLRILRGTKTARKLTTGARTTRLFNLITSASLIRLSTNVRRPHRIFRRITRVRTTFNDGVR